MDELADCAKLPVYSNTAHSSRFCHPRPHAALPRARANQRPAKERKRCDIVGNTRAMLFRATMVSARPLSTRARRHPQPRPALAFFSRNPPGALVDRGPWHAARRCLLTTVLLLLHVLRRRDERCNTSTREASEIRTLAHEARLNRIRLRAILGPPLRPAGLSERGRGFVYHFRSRIQGTVLYPRCRVQGSGFRV